MAPAAVSYLLSPESLSASGKASERLSLPMLQSRMKLDPEGYDTELLLIYRHFKSTLQLFRQQSALNPSSDPVLSKDLGDLAMFLAHMIPFYPLHLAEFPGQISDILRSDARTLPSSLRCHLVQAIILLGNRKIVELEASLDLFMDLQIIGDRTLKKLALSHVVNNIRRMNKKHRNEAKNQKLQIVLFRLLQGEEELRARRSLVILCDLHRRKIWFDDRTANAICNACFHTSSRVMVSALSFLLGYECNAVNDSEDSDSEDDESSPNPQVVLSRDKIYKANHLGTTSSKKKKKAKLQRVIRSMKKQQRQSEEKIGSNSYSPLSHLKDAQGFVEKLFSRLHTCHERFEVRIMMMKVIARTIGLHSLILLNFYPFLQRYVQPHQREVTTLLAAGIQACHEKVPPDAVEPLFKQIVNQFVHDRSRPEAITVGLNAVREMCVRMPLLMNEDLLQDLVLYKKSHEKSVSIAARSLVTLFREICPSLLVKKDRGRPINPKARPKAFGEVHVASEVPGIDLLQHDEEQTSGSDDDLDATADTDSSQRQTIGVDDACEMEKEDDDDNHDSDHDVNHDDDVNIDDNDNHNDDDNIDDDDDEVDDSLNEDGEEEDELDTEDENDTADNDVLYDSNVTGSESEGMTDGDNGDDDHESSDAVKVEDGPKTKKRKLEYHGGLSSMCESLRALKRLAGIKTAKVSLDEADGILSDRDFQHIKELKAKKDAKQALALHGLLKKDANSSAYKIPSSEQLSAKRLDPDKLQAHIRNKLSKEEKMAMVRAGREDRGQYQARAALKQKKTGGLSNRQKQHKKAMPLAAKRARAARSRQEKKQLRKHAGKQFKGRKAWK